MKLSQHYFTFPLYLPRLCRTLRNWPLYLTNYLLRRKRPATYLLRDGAVLRDATGTLAGTFAVVFLRQEYGSPDGAEVILDVGANMGCFSLFAARRCPDAHIIACEPSKANLEVLEDNIMANRLGARIVVERVALGASTGQRSLAVGQSPLNSLVLQQDSSVREMVACITLNDLMTAHSLTRIDFLKINCEGAEYEILQSLPRSAFIRIPRVRLEYHNFDEERHNGRALARLLVSHGYEITRYTNYRGTSGFIWADLPTVDRAG